MTASPDASKHRARILIVDDQSDNRALMEIILAHEGFLTFTASSGEEALAVLARESPDLILLDVLLPGMDGHQVVREIKGNLATKDIPIIMITGIDSQRARVLAVSAGAADYLAKPVDRADLCARVRKLLPMATSSH